MEGLVEIQGAGGSVVEMNGRVELSTPRCVSVDPEADDA